MPTVVNKTFEEIAPGDAVSIERTVQARDVRAWDAAFGDPELRAGLCESPATTGIVSSILTALVGSALPGPGSIIRAMSVQITGPLPIGRAMTVRLTVREKRSDQGIVILDGECTGPEGEPVATASLEVLAPTQRLQREMNEHRLEGLIERCRGLAPMLTGVVHPCSAEALAGAVEAAAASLILPVLFGPEAEIRKIADQNSFRHQQIPHRSLGRRRNSAQKAAMAAGAGQVAALMKGSLHTDIFLHAAMQNEAKLRSGRRIGAIVSCYPCRPMRAASSSPTLL